MGVEQREDGSNYITTDHPYEQGPDEQKAHAGQYESADYSLTPTSYSNEPVQEYEAKDQPAPEEVAPETIEEVAQPEHKPQEDLSDVVSE